MRHISFYLEQALERIFNGDLEVKTEPTLSKIWQVTVERNHVTRTCTWIVPVAITEARAHKQIAEFYPRHKILGVKAMENG